MPHHTSSHQPTHPHTSHDASHNHKLTHVQWKGGHCNARHRHTQRKHGLDSSQQDLHETLLTEWHDDSHTAHNQCTSDTEQH